MAAKSLPRALVSGLERRLKKVVPIQVRPALCAWCDLLGFGEPFTRTGWNPSESDWIRMLQRIKRAQQQHLLRLSVIDEFTLMLNDGIVRTRTLHGRPTELGFIAFWLSQVIAGHVDINYIERSEQLPGARTVVAAGQRALYTFGEVQVHELVKNKPRRRSELEIPGHPRGYMTTRAVALNPDELQMNTAFSKAYILDSIGTRGGIGGANLYIDESIWSYIRALAAQPDAQFRAIERKTPDGFLFETINTDGNTQHRNFAVQCEPNPIEVRHPSLTTTVYRLTEFRGAGFRIHVLPILKHGHWQDWDGSRQTE